MFKWMFIFPCLSLFIGTNTPAAELPAIYLERIASDDGAIAKALKTNYDQCVSSKAILKKIKQEMGKKSVAWEAAQETYEKKIIANVDYSPLPEPDWKTLKPKRVEEYFDQEKFTRRTYITRYRIDLARCELKDREDLTLRIDNGEKEVRIDFKGKKKKNIASVAGVYVAIHAEHYRSYKVKVRPSPRVSRDQLLANNEALRNMPGALRRLADQLTLPVDATEPGAGGLSLPTERERDYLEEALDFKQQKYVQPNVGPGQPQQAGEQIIAGQPCDMTELGKLGGKLCLWHKMNRYPDEYGAQVILLKESGLGNRRLVEEATEFKLMDHINPEVFQVPPGVKI